MFSNGAHVKIVDYVNFYFEKRKLFVITKIIMIKSHLIILFCWIWCVQGEPIGIRPVQFIPRATSFVRRTDIYKGIPEFGSDLSAENDVLTFHLDNIPVHTTPDYSNGLAYPDPFLRTGIQAKLLASHLYSKELFFDDIPHLRAVLYNQKQRYENGISPHHLGSLRPETPWYRFRKIDAFTGIY
ncbi:hypothetical protein ABEB36_004481 [Hypothenemus hampei]|uniref:Uncharacterized protein n=1 Tax=Hypothenemus hampei TaxID=57062 RepID=A0ABD1F3J6_HYPHA